MNTKQIQQIMHFLSAYPKDVVELGIEAWRNGEMPVVESQYIDVIARSPESLRDDVAISNILSYTKTRLRSLSRAAQLRLLRLQLAMTLFRGSQIVFHRGNQEKC